MFIQIAKEWELLWLGISAWISSVSQVRACVCNIPVPEAIERLQTERPRKRRCRYSPKESHCFTREKVPGLGWPASAAWQANNWHASVRPFVHGPQLHRTACPALSLPHERVYLPRG